MLVQILPEGPSVGEVLNKARSLLKGRLAVSVLTEIPRPGRLIFRQVLSVPVGGSYDRYRKPLRSSDC